MCDDSSLRGLYCVGIGPGDPRMVTLRALQVLQEADVIHIPKGRASGSLVQDILISLPDLKAELREIDFSMARSVALRQEHWDCKAVEIRSVIERSGYFLCVTLGDPSIYSTMAYLTGALKRLDGQVPITMVPGISSLQAAAAELTSPLVIGDEELVVVPFPETEGRLRQLLDRHAKLVCMKIGKRIGDAVQWLAGIEDGYGISLVKKAGLSDREVYHGLEEIRQADGNLSILFIEKSEGK